MTEINAQQKRPCPACGGEAIWDAAKQALACPFCGTVFPALASGAAIVEHDLISALNAVSDSQRGWNVERRSVRCQECLAITVFDSAKVGKKCDFCGSSQLVPYEQTKAPFRPESILPFKTSESAARDALRAWYKKVWFAPNNLSKLSMADTFKGIYLPYWTFDAQAEADWEAEAGYYYYTTEEYTDSNGKRETRQVQHTRWQSASGNVKHQFDDLLVPGSKGVQSDLLSRLGSFPTSDLVPYDTSYVAGWTIEQYQIDLAAAANLVNQRMENELQQLCASAIPGDTYRNLTVQSRFKNRTFKHILLPVWLATYYYGAKSFQVLVNGVTNQVTGNYPKSVIKIAAAIVVIITLVALFLILKSQH